MIKTYDAVDATPNNEPVILVIFATFEVIDPVIFTEPDIKTDCVNGLM